jgi:hypothetical protein
MAIKIYSSANYVIVEDGANTFEYAKGHSLYTYSGGVYTIKEITQGEFKVSDRQIDDGFITNNLSVAYTKATFVAFLRENTGFKTASGGSGATWGSITGTLSAQTDLQTAIDEKLNEDFSSLTSAEPLDGTEVVPIVQDGATVKVTTQDIADLGSGGGGIHLQRTVPSGSYGNLFIVYSAFTTSAASANRLHLYPFIPNKDITIQSLTISVSTLFAGGLAKILIYSDVSGVPTTKLYESADLNCSTTGIKTATTSQTFIAGTTYWIGFIANNSTNVFSFYNQAAVLGFGTSNFSTATYAFLNTTFASIPDTLTSVSYSSGNIPAVTLQNL